MNFLNNYVADIAKRTVKRSTREEIKKQCCEGRKKDLI